MTGSGGHLALRPELCDRCGKCVRACPQAKLRVGAGYIYVDASACTSCFACVGACERGAILRSEPSRPVAHRASGSAGELGKVVVGSRAEAKALRKQAEATKKAAAKAEKRLEEPPALAASRPVSGVRTALSSADTARIDTGGVVTWALRDAGIVLVVLAATLAAKQAVMGSEAMAVIPPSARVAARTLVLALFYATQLGVLVFLAYLRGGSFRTAFRLRPAGAGARSAGIAVALVAALLIGTRALSTAWGALAQSSGWAPPASEALTGVFGAGGAGLAVAVTMVVVVGPFIEELAFRGVIASAMEARLGMWPAIVVSSAVFAAYHLTPWVAVPTFVLGCALAWLALTRSSLLPAIALHVLYNGVVVAAAFWIPST